MIRERVIQVIVYGRMREALEALTELDQVCRAKGIPAITVWVPVAGTNNELIFETEYESLADFEHQQAAFYSDPDTMKIWRKAVEFIVEGSGRSELLQTAPSLA